MKIGAKEMKKAYKNVKIDQIEVNTKSFLFPQKSAGNKLSFQVCKIDQ